MGLSKDIQIGMGNYGRAIQFIFKHKLFWAFLVPLALNILLLSSLLIWINELTDQSIDYMNGLIQADSWDFWGADFLKSTVNFLIGTLLYLFSFLVYAFVGGYIILIILSPLLSYISEKTEKIVSHKEFDFSWKQLFKDSWRGILIALRNFGIELLAMLVLFFVSFIPLIGLLTAPALFFISSYYYGFSFMDYTSERRRLGLKQSISFVKQKKGIALGNGIPFALCLLIPFVGVSLSAFVAIVSTVAATLSILKTEEKNEQIQF